MKKTWIVYHDEYTPSPMSFWIHRMPKKRRRHELEWFQEYERSEYDPPLPGPVAGRGFPVLHTEFDDIVLRFSSLAELDRLIDVLSRRKLPTTYEAQREELSNGNGVNNTHWLSRLPASVLSLRVREKLVAYLKQAKRDFAKVVSMPPESDSTSEL
jgi:hypothetical protein